MQRRRRFFGGIHVHCKGKHSLKKPCAFRFFLLFAARIEDLVRQRYKLSAARNESFEKFGGTLPQGGKARNYNRFVFAFAHGFRKLLFPKRRQHRFVDKIEIYAVFIQRFAQSDQLFRKPRAFFFRGSPRRFYRVNHRYVHNLAAARKTGVHPREMIFDERKLFIPVRLYTDGSRIISLALAFHRVPRKVRHAQRNPHRRKPIALQFKTAEIEIPVRTAVQLAHHAVFSRLIYHRLHLRCGNIFPLVAKHIDPG